jgi:hypothetical protein
MLKIIKSLSLAIFLTLINVNIDGQTLSYSAVSANDEGCITCFPTGDPSCPFVSPATGRCHVVRKPF